MSQDLQAHNSSITKPDCLTEWQQRVTDHGNNQWLHGQKYARDKAAHTDRLYFGVKGAIVRWSERVL